MSDYIKRLAGPYYGEGDKTFTFGFFTYTKEDIYVGTSMSNDEATTILELDVDYSVSLNEDQDATPGGSITLLNETGLKKGEALVIGSDLEPVKNIQLTNYSRFPPEQIDTEFNRIFIILQQLYEITGRVLEVPATSNETPEEMIERLLAAQQTAQAAADAAEAAKDAAEDILEDVQTYGEAAAKLEPIADEIVAVAGSKDAVEATGENITNVNIVAGDLDTTTQPIDVDYGDYDDESGSGEVEVPTGGNIVVVAQNIEAVKTVGQNMPSILAIEDKIDGLDQTIEEMNEAVASAQTAQAAAESAAGQASQSATNAADQVTIAKDWAIKLDGKVQEGGVEIDYSAKYWAQQAESSADDAASTLTQVTQAGETAVSNVQSAQSTAVQAVNSAGTTQIGAVEDAKDSAVAAVSAQQTTSVNAVNAAGQTQAQAVTDEGVKQVGLVEDAGESQVSAVNTAGAQQTANAQAQAQAAAQSASEALQHKTDAESAKTAAETARDAAVAAQTAAETAKSQAQSAQSTAETAAGTATSKASEASGYATSASNAQTAAESARDAAIAAKEAAEDIAGEIGDPLGKAEAAQTYLSKTDAAASYATKTEVTSGLSGKANTSHTHQQTDVEGLGTALAGKANSTHTHEISQVNGLQSALDGKQAAGDYAAATHTHTASQVTDLGTLATKNEITAAEMAATIDYGEYADA